MGQCRREVSEVRYELILKEHIEATLKEVSNPFIKFFITNYTNIYFHYQKLSNIEDLGNGLTMKDYENLQNVTQILGKKLEGKKQSRVVEIYIS